MKFSSMEYYIEKSIKCSQTRTDFEATHIAEIFIQQLDVSVNYFQREKLIVRAFDAATKIQASISGSKQFYHATSLQII